MNALNLTTVDISSDRERLVILDQTLLPNEIKHLELDDRESIYEAIKKLRVRGAPAIGVAAAYGIYVLARKFGGDNKDEFAEFFHREKEYPDLQLSTSHGHFAVWKLSWIITCSP